jgi:hypothetical protein
MKRAPFWISAFLILLIGLIPVACSKDKYTTKPQLSIKSVNSTLIPLGGGLDVILQYTSKKGNLGGGKFVAIRTRLNQDFLQNSNTDTFSGTIPQFPNQSKAEFDFTADWQSLYDANSGNPTEPDTIIFKFAAIDTDNNTSDTITSPRIIVLGQ